MLTQIAEYIEWIGFQIAHDAKQMFPFWLATFRVGFDVDLIHLRQQRKLVEDAIDTYTIFVLWVLAVIEQATEIGVWRVEDYGFLEVMTR